MENEMEYQVESQKGEDFVGGPSMGVLIALIAALCLGVIGIFAMLGILIPQEEKSDKVWTYVQNEDGQEVRYNLRTLDQAERQETDVLSWLTGSQNWSEEDVYWLYRQDSDEYVLYLPTQDRVTTKDEITVTEETDPDGEVALVIRVRTAEKAEKVTPETQLFVLRTMSENWRGLRVRVIQDGREKTVNQMTSKGDELYTTDEWYIGRF